MDPDAWLAQAAAIGLLLVTGRDGATAQVAARAPSVAMLPVAVSDQVEARRPLLVTLPDVVTVPDVAIDRGVAMGPL